MMAECDALRLLHLDKAIQAPTPKWHRSAKVYTPGLGVATPKTRDAKMPSFTSTDRSRVVSTTKRDREKLTKSCKLEREDGDRFIPNRTLTDMNYASHQMLRKHDDTAGNDDEDSKSMYEFGSSCKRKIGGIQPPSTGKAFSCNWKAKLKKDIRKVPAEPEKILDAPEVIDDFYINPLAWSTKNQIAIALGREVYLWSAVDCSAAQLTQLPQASEYISSVAWGKRGSYLAIGASNSHIQLWDVDKQQKLRDLKKGHTTRVGCLDWNSFILASGSEDGTICLHDVRQKEALVTQTQAHSLEVCGIKWSADGCLLASGGNDNAVLVWNLPLTKEPVHKLIEHSSAVKALAWCPWNTNILATGGGSNDRTIKLWNILNGSCQHTVDVDSPVSSVLWSAESRELVTGHGHPHNHLSIWSYPSMSKVADLTGHTNRIIQLASSPDGTSVASLGADETLRIWRCFDSCPGKRPKPTKTMEQLSNSQIFRESHERLR